MPITIERIIERVANYWPKLDRDFLLRAYQFADAAHEGQKRLSGEPYIVHPLNVAVILTEIESDPFAVAGAFLHDTVEDTEVTIDDVRDEFGDTVSRLVEGVTKLGKLDFSSQEEEQARNLRKMFLAMGQDLRVIVIKLADRLHNMRTLQPLNHDLQIQKSEETLHIYAPLCHRLGIHRIYWELEDLAFKYLEPDTYDEIRRRIGLTREERDALIDQARSSLKKHLENNGIEANIQGRAKHLYSIARKMRTRQINFSQIRDLNALRVVVDTVGECYGALGAVHELWTPIPDGFADHIAMPKANQYQSLHTKVLGPSNSPMEVQIRTMEMHRTAEYGVAAHWRYKEGGSDEDLDDQIQWLRQLLELQSDLSESHEFLELLQIDLFKDQVFVFTPKGDVIDLPAGAGPIDFAYRIHTEVGHHCVGALVNGAQVGLDYELKNGDICEIVTSPGGEPRHDWLRLIQSSHAKAKVRRYLREQTRKENIRTGTEKFERAISRLNPGERQKAREADIEKAADHFNYSEEDALMAAIGYGDVSTDAVLEFLLDRGAQPSSLVDEAQFMLPTDSPPPASVTDDEALPVSAGGVDGFHSRLSKCCDPLPGDDIVGYITRGRGLAIHRADCKNLAYHAQKEPDRIVELKWSDDEQATIFRQDIEVVALDRVGILSHITAIISDADINIAHAEATKASDHLARLRLTLEIRRREDLTRVLQRLRDLIDVVNVRRLGQQPAPTG
ncbi:MAG: bifunctional (p)ppGpp synthetase/guanosine-3',5'-bis(diphosphate) 3'-pyrophosphohydrolase [Armatimonadota bacterium]